MFFLARSFPAALATLILLVLPPVRISANANPTDSADVVVYGATSAGVMAAVRAARENRSVILIAPDGHIGGTTTGGLGQTDAGGAMSGMAHEFYSRVHLHYDNPEAWKYETREEYFDADWYDLWSLEGRSWSRRWRNGAALTFEPSVAANVMNEMLAEVGLNVIRDEWLDRDAGLNTSNGRILSIAMESGRVFEAEVFIDATYEGDLMAAAGVTYIVGRETNSDYGETLNGVQTQRATSHQLPSGIDPYVIPGDPASGLLPGIDPTGPGAEGSGDHRVQAYNIRITMTDVPENRVPFHQPADYNELEYELLFRAFDAGLDAVPLHAARMPNRKTDTNNSRGFSTDFIGRSYDYPDADHIRRAEIVAEHRTYIQGLLWTLANHPRVPANIRAQLEGWGYAADEFVENENLSPQLYVREARRMVSDYVMTEADVRGHRAAPDGVAIGGYQIDSHHTQRYITGDGHVRNEGDVQTGAVSYGISYRSIVPRKGETRNLIVPACVSATHVAHGTIRMEPIYMQLGHVAGLAAAMAVEEGIDVQDVDYLSLRTRLVDQGQVLPPYSPPPEEPPPFYAGFRNGGFEEEPFDRFWSVSQNVLPHPGFAPASTTAVFLPVNPSSENPVNLVQNRPYWLPYTIAPDSSSGEFIQTEPKWRLELYVVVSDPGAPDKRSLNLLIGHNRSGGGSPPQINFRITGSGAAEAFSSGSGWQLVLPPGTFDFSTVEQNTFPDPAAYRIQFEGDYSGPSPAYRVSASRSGAGETVSSELIQAWQYGNPHPGDGIIFFRAHGYIDAPYALDDIRLVSDSDLPDGFLAWRRQFFSEAERADPVISGIHATPAGDGVSNLLKYALGLPPFADGAPALPSVSRKGFDGADYLTLSFTRPSGISDIAYRVETSSDLVEWETQAVEGNSDETKHDTTTHLFRDMIPIGDANRRFLRLRVESASSPSN